MATTATTTHLKTVDQLLATARAALLDASVAMTALNKVPNVDRPALLDLNRYVDNALRSTLSAKGEAAAALRISRA